LSKEDRKINKNIVFETSEEETSERGNFRQRNRNQYREKSNNRYNDNFQPRRQNKKKFGEKSGQNTSKKRFS